MEVIPAIDLLGGKVVRLYKGDFNQVTEYPEPPVEVATRYGNAGVESLHIVDLDGAQSGEQKNRRLVQRIAAATDFDIQLGGGIRNEVMLRSWLDAGVSRCVIGSVAVTDAESVKQWFGNFGPDNIVLALDVRLNDDGSPLLSTHGWTRASDSTLWQCVDDFSSVGLKHVLCTDISRDGAMSGPNVDLYLDFMQRYPGIQLQASGGVRNMDDLERLRDAGAAAAITGRALLDGKITKEEIESFQRVA